MPALLGPSAKTAPDVDDAVAAIIADVRARGDAAVIELTAKFDRLDADTVHDRVSPEIESAVAQVPAADRAALELAAERIRAYHARQMPETRAGRMRRGPNWAGAGGQSSAAGLYVPGGLASYPSSVLMNAVPAKVAGVPRLAMMVPTPGGVVNPLVLLAARVAGWTKSTGSAARRPSRRWPTAPRRSRRWTRSPGPGNAYVAAAKRRVFGKVGIDMIAGPSEILVIADADNDPDWIALDLMSQAEHDESAQSILITDDAGLPRAVADAVERGCKRWNAARSRGLWRDFGAVITVRDMAEAAALSDRIAPEHLELCVADPERWPPASPMPGRCSWGTGRPRRSATISAGPNHVLPTARSARFSSGCRGAGFPQAHDAGADDAREPAAIGPAAEVLALGKPGGPRAECHGPARPAQPLERIEPARLSDLPDAMTRLT